jgi:hypothetical protein
MLNPQLLNTTPWHELFGFFLKGNPPLFVLLLAMNAVFFILFVLHRMRGKNAVRKSTGYVMQFAVILANFMLVYHQQIFQYAKTTSRLI